MATTEGMRSTATAKPESRGALTQADINRQTAESAQRTAEALAKQDLAELDSVDTTALALAKGVDPGLSGSSGVATLADVAAPDAEEAEKARRRSEASSEAAATRKRNAAKKAARKK